MDDQIALLERQVTTAASAWHRVKADTEAYRRMVVATDAWEAYCAPTLTGTAPDPLTTQLLRVARQKLTHADEEAARLAHLVTMATSTWLRATPATESEAYRQFDDAIHDWDRYESPPLEAPAEELLDQLADARAPLAVRDAVDEVATRLRGAR